MFFVIICGNFEFKTKVLLLFISCQFLLVSCQSKLKSSLNTWDNVLCFNSSMCIPLLTPTPLYPTIQKFNPLCLGNNIKFQRIVWICAYTGPTHGGSGHAGFLSDWSPKFCNNIFLFVGPKTLGTFNEFWLFGSLNWVSKRFNH